MEENAKKIYGNDDIVIEEKGDTKVVTIKGGMYTGIYIIDADENVTDENGAVNEKVKENILFQVDHILVPKDENTDESLEIKASNLNSWEALPETWKIVKKTPKLPYTNSPYDKGLQSIVAPYGGTDTLRIKLSGINFDKHGITVTDAHKMIHLPFPNKEFNGIYCTLPVCKKAGLKDDKIEEVYPDYPKVIPTSNKYVHKVSILKLKTFIKAILLSKHTNEITYKTVLNYGKDDEGNYLNIGVNAKYLDEVLESVLKLGNEFIYVGISMPNRPIIFSANKTAAKKPTEFVGKETIILLMPVMIDSRDATEYNTTAERISAAEDLDYDRHFNMSYCLSDDEIYNHDGKIAVFDYNLVKATTKDMTTEQEKILGQYLPKNSAIPIIGYVKVDGDTDNTGNGIATATDLGDVLQLIIKSKPSGMYSFINGALSLEPSISMDDYPLIGFNAPYLYEQKDFKGYGTINRVELLFHLEKAVLNIGKDDFRPVMNGVHLVKNEATGNDLIIEATNAHTLYRNIIHNHGITDDININIDNPARVVTFLKNIADTNIKLYASGTNMSMLSDTAIIIHRLLEGKYPNTEGVIPAKTTKMVSMDISELKECIKNITKEEKAHSLFFNKIDSDGKIKVDLYQEQYQNPSTYVRTLCQITSVFEEKSYDINKKDVFLGMPIIAGTDGYFALGYKILDVFMKTSESDKLNIYFSEPNRALMLADKDIEGNFDIINAPVKDKKSVDKKTIVKATKKDEAENDVMALQVLLSMLDKPYEKELVQKEIIKLQAA